MKHVAFISVFLTGLTCFGQTPSLTGTDSAKHLGKGSISFTARVNVTYPEVTQLIVGYNSFGSLVIVPSTSAQLCLDLKYNATFRRTKHSSFGMSFGFGYVQYKYSGIEFMPYEETESEIPALQKINMLEIHTGFFVNEKIIKRIGWYNEIGLLGSVQVYELFNPIGPNPSWSWPVGYYPLLNLTNEENANVYMYYQTGLRIGISSKFSITPTIEFLLFNITSRSRTWNSEFNNTPQYYYQIDAFNSYRTGITLTYKFSKIRTKNKLHG
jgi:hypothetical protein